MIAISGPLIQLGRTSEARKVLIELQRQEASEPRPLALPIAWERSRSI